MHIYKKSVRYFRFSHFLFYAFAVSFWCILLYAFDAPYAANATLIAAIVHELGHMLAFRTLNESSSVPKPRLFGFRIKSSAWASYKKDIICAASGPLANIILCLFGLPILFLSTDAYSVFAVISLATAASNLLPVKGYDGYKILTSAAHLMSDSSVIINIIDAFSFLTVCALTFASLFFIAKFNEGYWIFILFFCLLLSEIGKYVKHAKIEIK